MRWLRQKCKWDCLALWLRTTVRQASVIKVLNGAGCCGTAKRALRLERHASNISLLDVDQGLKRLVQDNGAVLSFAFDNIDIAKGPLDGRSTHWMNGLAVFTRLDLQSVAATAVREMPAWQKPLGDLKDIKPIDEPKCVVLPRDPSHTYTKQQHGPFFGPQTEDGLGQTLQYTVLSLQEGTERGSEGHYPGCIL